MHSDASERPYEDAVIAAAIELTRHPRGLLGLEKHVEDDLGIRPPLRVAILREAARRLGTKVTEREAAEAASCRRLSGLVDILRRFPRAIAPAGRLAGKVALITGSGHGVGSETARELARAGAAVVVNSFHSRSRGEDLARELTDEGHEVHHIWGSVAQPTHMDAIFSQIRDRYGRLDYFVSNASNGFVGPIEHISPEMWERSYRTNVMGFHRGAIRAAELMTRGGRIITLSSPGARYTFEMFACQGTIKAAVEALARHLAFELASRNIHVQAVSCGPIYGEQLASFPDHDKWLPWLEARSVGGKVISELEVARFVSRLLTEPVHPASSGSLIELDRGISALVAPFKSGTA